MKATLAIAFGATCAFTGCIATTDSVPTERLGTQAAAYSDPDLFTKLQEAETVFPRPTPEGTIVVGTLDASTGLFSGLTTIRATNPLTGKPMTLTPARDLAAIRANLQFDVENRGTSAFEVSIGGHTYIAPAGATSITVPVGLAGLVAWQVEANGHSYSDSLTITRDTQNGIGAFTVPIVPLSIVYEPPQPAGVDGGTPLYNTACFSNSNSLASTTSAGTSSDTSSNTSFDSMAQFQGAVDDLGKVLPSSVSGQLTNLSALFGDHKETYTGGTKQTDSSSITLQSTSATATCTSEHLGPGLGDVAVFLRNARLAWVLRQGQPGLILIDFDVLASVAESQLSSDLASLAANPALAAGPLTGLTAESLKTLTNADPFVAGGPGATLDPNRFVLADSYQVGGAQQTIVSSQTISSTDLTATDSYSTTVTDDTEGLLGIIGIGVTSDDNSTVTLTQSSSQSLTVGQTVTSSFVINAGPTDDYTLDVYYDRMYGNFAYVKRSPVIVRLPVKTR